MEDAHDERERVAVRAQPGRPQPAPPPRFPPATQPRAHQPHIPPARLPPCQTAAPRPALPQRSTAAAPNFMDRGVLSSARHLDEAWAWGFDVDAWRAHLGVLTWPEVLRQVAVALGRGSCRPPKPKPAPANQRIQV